MNHPIADDLILEVKKTALKSAEDAYVQVKSVAFSIGSDAGSYPIWAYGHGRWFEINPRPEYQEMYRHMVDGVTFYYALTDFYDEHPNAPVESALSRVSLKLRLIDCKLNSIVRTA